MAVGVQGLGFRVRVQVLNTFYFLTGYLGFLATWIMDTIYTFVKNATLEWWDHTVKTVARALSPHFVLARGLYDISQVRLLKCQGTPIMYRLP